MKRVLNWTGILLTALFLAGLLSVLSWEIAAATAESDCATAGGSWAGTTPDDGVCTYPAGSPMALSYCGPGVAFTQTFAGIEPDDACDTPVSLLSSPPSKSSDAAPNGCASELRGPLPQPRTVSLCNGQNGSAMFPMGACSQKCTIRKALPAPAGRKLPQRVIATMYVRIVKPGGLPGDDAYVVCFSLKDLGLKEPAIYRFVSGAWQLVALGTANSNALCAAANGDGAFYLGEQKKK